MKNIKIQTKGMHCPSCEMLVTDELNDQKGVVKSKADHKTGIVEVEFDETKINLNKIKEIIKQEGYNVE